MKLAIAQLNPTIGDIAGNGARILAAAQAAAAQGAELLLTPELSLCGYPPRDLLLNPAFIQKLQTELTAIAAQLPPQLAVLIGTVDPRTTADQDGGKPLYNSMALLQNGSVQRQFHKRLLPTYDVFDEDRYFASGEAVNVLELGPLRIGLTICEDLWNDEQFWGRRNYETNPIADLADATVDFVINLSASPFSVGKQLLRKSLLQHAAQTHHFAVVYVNQVGGNDDLVFDGRSLVVNASGDIVAQGKAFAEDVLVVDYDPARRAFATGPCAPQPPTGPGEVWSALVLGVRDYARKCGFTQAVIGLSGGIDSALVAAIAAEALGPENVLGVLMPSPYSSDHSINDALALANSLGMSTKTLPIEDLMHGFDHTLEPLFAGTTVGVAEENIQARIRGNLLMAIANKFNRLLISTGNKSELAVGYCTLYGDMSGGLAAIADVPKTLVYRLCRWLNSPDAKDWLQQLYPPSGEVIPAAILTKAPSAELKPDQTDQDTLPDYEILDDILARAIDQHQSAQDMITAGHEPLIVQRTLKMLQRAEFKRQQAAPGIKITDRAFGTGWRMPIAAHWQPSR